MNSNPWGEISGIRPVKIIRTMLKNGKTEQEAEEFFKLQHKVSSEKTKLSLQIARLEMNILKDINENDICLYIGIPFCKTRCLYCSFVTNTASNSAHLIQPFVEALVKEIQYTSEIVKQMGSRVVSLYIGGGTPTTLSPEQLNAIITQCKKWFDLSALKEFTVEAGRPDTIDEPKLVALKNFGVTRISINPQTMNDKTLKLIGRQHSANEIIDSFNLARNLGFDNINMDIIAGLPGEDLIDFIHTLKEVEALNPESITVHTMSIKRGSKLHETLGDYALTDGKIVASMVDYALDYICKHNKKPYYLYRQKNILGNLENVGYSKSGYECLYNIMIMEETSTIISLGAGGVTKTVNPKNDRIERIFNVKETSEYVSRIDEMCRRKDSIIKFL